jgi:hypothetical protein
MGLGEASFPVTTMASVAGDLFPSGATYDVKIGILNRQHRSLVNFVSTVRQATAELHGKGNAPGALISPRRHFVCGS